MELEHAHALHFQTTPHDYQLMALAKSLNVESYALLMEQGTGKTKVAIDTAANLYLQGKIEAVIVVAPVGVHRNWIQDELPKHCLPSVNSAGEKLLPLHTHLYLSSFAKTQKAQNFREKFLHDSKSLKVLAIIPQAVLTKNGEAFCTEILRKFKTLFIVDEASKILKNPRAKQTRIITELGKLAKYRRILTGTAITKSPLDLYGPFNFLDKSIMGFTNYYSFKHMYAIEKLFGGGGRMFPKITGYRNLDDLVSRISPFSFRVLKSDVLKQLPDKIYKKHYYELDAAQQKSYRALKLDSVAYVNAPTTDAELLNCILNGTNIISTNHALTKLLRLQQILSGYVPTDDGRVISMFPLRSNPRITALQEILEDIEGKCIIWCRFVHEIRAIKELLGDEAVTYYGDMKEEECAEQLTKFRTVKTVKYFIATPAKGGFGLTLVEASNMIYFSNDFNLETRLQSEDRCHRIGQKSNVLIYDIVASETIDEHIIRILQQKMQYSVLLDNMNKTDLTKTTGG